jgi:SAM-dependent methyltransferase
VDRTAYDRFFALEQAHFWRIAKRRLVLDWLKRYHPGLAADRSNLRILDIGGACSLIPREFQRWGTVRVIEPDPDTAAFAREKLGLDVIVGLFPDRGAVDGPFDVVSMLDVLEHIEDDLAALKAARGLLAPDGVLICTVPALKWLWSDHDVALHHFRRYTRRELMSVLSRAGFRVQRVSYYTGILLPVLAAQRLVGRLRRRSGAKPEYDVRVPPAPLNQMMGLAMSVERSLLRWFDCLLGSSLIAVARRDADLRHS